MGFLVSSKEKDEDLGLAIRLDCPRCEEETQFRVVVTTSTLIVIVIPFPSETDARICCTECEYTALLQDYEVDQLKRLVGDLKNGRLDLDGAQERLHKMKIGAVEDTKALAETWACECGEDVPMTFATCWSCSAEAPAGTPIVEGDDQSIGAHYDPVMGVQSPQIQSPTRDSAGN